MPTSALDIACLCAAWCRLCDGYAPVLRGVVAEGVAAGQPLRLHWIDIEDDADLVGDLDVETFPTLVIVDAAGRVRFAGPVTPQPQAVRRLFRSVLAEDGAGPAPGVTPEAVAFAARLRMHLAAKRETEPESR